MKPKKITDILTSGSVILTFLLLALYIILMSINAEKYSGWLQILSIAIQLLASFIGVFLAIRMSQWISDKEEKEKVNDLWKRVLNFLNQLKSDIVTNKKLMELAEYKSYWQSVQNASYESAKALHDDEKYMEISIIFSFLSYHESEWGSREATVSNWKANSSNALRTQIEAWESKIDDMICYVNQKIKNNGIKR